MSIREESDIGRLLEQLKTHSNSGLSQNVSVDFRISPKYRMFSIFYNEVNCK